MDVERNSVNQQVRATDEIEADGPDPFPHLVGESMMVPEQVQAGVHRPEQLVDLRLAGIGPARTRKGQERLRGLVGHEHVDAADRRARLDFLVDEMTTLIGQLGRLRTPLLRVRQLGCAALVPGRRERAPQAGDTQSIDLDRRPVWNVLKSWREIARRDRVEVVVVAVDPVDRRADGLVPPLGAGQVPDRKPPGDLGMPRDDRPRGLERAVDVP
jgi:hypothetical protein